MLKINKKLLALLIAIPAITGIVGVKNLLSYDSSNTPQQTPQPSVQTPTPAQNTPVPQPDFAYSKEYKRIEVDLTNQRLYAYEGDTLVYNFLISSGKWYKTPTGVFHIWIKLRYTRMTGGSKTLHTYYDLPNVPFTMYFYNDQIPQSAGYGIHGTYWHHNFGHPMSHGCINMRTQDAQTLYYWANPDLQGNQSIHASTDNPGTEVVIFGTTPAN